MAALRPRLLLACSAALLRPAWSLDNGLGRTPVMGWNR